MMNFLDMSPEMLTALVTSLFGGAGTLYGVLRDGKSTREAIEKLGQRMERVERRLGLHDDEDEDHNGAVPQETNARRSHARG